MLQTFNPFGINTSKYGTNISINMNQSTDDYVITVDLVNKDGTIISTSSIDLPIETLVKSGRYDSETKTIILVLENDEEIRIPIGGLISGLQEEITSNNMLNADLVNDATSVNKFITSQQEAIWDSYTIHKYTNSSIGEITFKFEKTVDGTEMQIGDTITLVQSDWNQTDNSAEDFIKNKPTIPAAQVNSDWTASSGIAEILHKPTLGTAAAKNYTTSISGLSDDLVTSSAVNAALADKADKSTTYTKTEFDTALVAKADLVDGKVPASELPSYVDDTVEGYYYQGAFYEDSEHTIMITGETGKIYIDLTTNKSYRWTGTVYVRIDECPAFGETQGTIYEGNKGKQNADAIAKKPGKITTREKYIIDGQTVTAGTGAEVFNDLVNNKAVGPYSHAEGLRTTASGNQSHAEGNGVTASGHQSHAEGNGVTASGYCSHAEGRNTIASGSQSHVEGIGTKAYSDNQHVQGKFNDVDANGTYAFIIGNGTSDNASHNAFAIDWNGLIYVNGASTGVDVSALAPQSTTYTKTEVDTALAGKANTSSLAAVATSGNYNDLSNKPTIPAAQVNADWDAVSGVSQILNKPTIPAAQVSSDWNASSGVAQILNKPTLGAAASYGVDTVATSGSTNLITSGGVYAIVGDINTVLESVL